MLDWGEARWNGVKRPYSQEDVRKLQNSIHIEHSLARHGSERLWGLLREGVVAALGALTGHQAVQQIQAGLLAVYLSGWQVAGDANSGLETYPDLSLYPANSVPMVVSRINRAFRRADQIAKQNNDDSIHWFAPIVADAEAGFGGNLNAYELMIHMIEAGASGVHFEDQLSSAKKCGHLGGKVLVPTGAFIQKLIAARLAADVADVPTVLFARTDADSAQLLTSDVDERDKEFIVGDRTSEGFFKITGGLDCAIARGLAYAPYADLIWCETSVPDLKDAKIFAEAIKEFHPDKMLAYNCSPSFNWKKTLDDVTIAKFRRELGAMGYTFQFITLAGFHSLNHSMYQLALAYKEQGMTAYAALQAEEFRAEPTGYKATKHQQYVGVGYFDEIAKLISSGEASTLALDGSTEEKQF